MKTSPLTPLQRLDEIRDALNAALTVIPRAPGRCTDPPTRDALYRALTVVLMRIIEAKDQQPSVTRITYRR